ncbi:general stress protein [Paenibacillus sp. GCM10012307]|uniref:General stress protein n=1 Tax=Paenibacillus roseus TaxID=2798579 RepID=A0A934J6L6_9BACL|nr:general stress protein [Paenibacillus roseus]MBJ6361342.1 general stress protein [Paenibacillus roseus]
MSKKLALFENQEQAIKTIEALQKDGFATTEITVLAKNKEHSRRIESETDVHVDELIELAQVADDNEAHVKGVFVTGALGVSPVGSGSMPGAYPLVGASGLVGMDFSSDFDKALGGFELEDSQRDACSEAIWAGSIAVIIETAESKSDSGSGISRLDKAEAAFRINGAQQIL